MSLVSGRCQYAVLIFLFFFFLEPLFGQADLKSLLDLAERNYPSIAAKQAEAEAVKVTVSLEKNTLLPSLDAAYQINYSTYNNITGMNYPGMIIPISGPLSADNNNDPVPGSAASLLFKWSPVTFGQRAASVEYNQNLYEKQLAGVEDEVLKVKFRVAFSYLEIAGTKELIKAYQKNIDRNEFNLKQINALVLAGIRPAVDSLKFKGELSKARTELFRLDNLLETQKQELFELLVTEAPQNIETNEFFIQNLPFQPINKLDSDLVQNPVLKMAQSDLAANQSRLLQINRSWTPKLEFWGTTYARGSGIGYDGTVNKAEGYSFSRYNYGLGVQLILPILDLTNIKLKSRQQEAITRSSESYLKKTRISLNNQETIAISNLKTLLKIANEVPVEYKASESAYNEIQARYSAGLIDYTDLIMAQYDLLNAEASMKNAYINSWKSLLILAVIHGDINIFINQIQN